MAAATAPSSSSSVRPNSSIRDSSASSSSTVISGTRQKQAANGAPPRPQPPAEANSSSKSLKESNTPDQHAHDRLLFLMASCVGCFAKVTVRSGERFAGVFSGSSVEPFESRYVLKMTKKLHPAPTGGASDEVDDVGYGEDYVMTFATTDVTDLEVENVSTDRAQARLPNGNSTAFRTDTDISGNLTMRERELQPWNPAPDDKIDMSLNSNAGKAWDQFETNERLFHVKTDYDENLYTTPLDRSQPNFRQRAAAADKIARDIERGGATNAHQAEVEDGADEEDRFSGVQRDYKPLASTNPNRYTPPARRAPTAHSTVPGAPVDPAIISSRMMKPEVSSSQQSKPQDSGTSASVAPTKKDEPTVPSIPDQESIQSGSQQPKPASVTHNQAGPLPSPSKPSGVTSAGRTPAVATNATSTVEKDVLKAFKNFSGAERMKMQDQHRKNVRQEREVKLNDLKKFATNFKLKTQVPPDIVGILAKDKERQEEIVKKSHKAIEEQTAGAKTPGIPPSQPGNQRPAGSTRTDSASASVEQPTPTTRGSRHGGRGRGDRSLGGPLPMIPPRSGQPSLGQRLIAQQSQFAQRQVPPVMPLQDIRIPSAAPGAMSTDSTANRGGTIPTPTSATSSRFNAQASEFRPNPTASTFSPTGPPSGASSSPAAPKPATKVKPTNRVSFFGDKRPGPISEKRLIEEGFNPVARMKKEVERDGKTKDFAINGGIPQAYRTPPTWDVREENLEKSYVDMFEAKPSIAHSASPTAPMPHQHQLPFHLQPGAPGIPQIHHTPQPTPPRHSYGGPMPQGPRGDHSYDDHRMHVSSSNHSMYPSPRFQQPNLVPHMGSPMFTQTQPAPYGQPQPVIMGMGPNGQQIRYVQQMPVGQQFATTQTMQMGSGGPQMVAGQPGGNTFMSVPVPPQQQMHVYSSPAPSHAFPAHLGGSSGPQTPGGYSNSPRAHAAHMMTPRGSQQGQAPGGPYMYVAPGQTGQNFPSQAPQGQHMIPVNRGMPMQHQVSYGASPHMQPYFPAGQQGRGGYQFSGQFPPQQPMHPAHTAMGPGQHGPPLHGAGAAIANHAGEHEEMK